jgi:hypothetical protein
MNDNFIEQYKNQLYYYYFEKYSLDQSYYDYTLKVYLQFFLDIQKGENIEKSLNGILKLKLLSQKPKNEDWYFPVAIHKDYFMAFGSGRVLVDFIFGKENKKTIVISNYSLDYPKNKIESTQELFEKVNIEGLSFYTKNGIIAGMFHRKLLFDNKKKKFIEQNKNELIQKIKRIDVENLTSVFNFLKTKEPFFN